jgi:hypothetical protein
MAQLVGQLCVFCNTRISSILDGRFCDRCRNPLHARCEPATREPGHCPDCGSDAPTAPPLHDNLRDGPRPIDGYPVSSVCPSCGSADYEVRRPDRWVAFVSDRVCTACHQRYVPPTPKWAAIVFIFVGLILAGFGALDLGLTVLHGVPPAPTSMLCGGFAAFIGILCIVHGFRAALLQGPPSAWDERRGG